MELLKAREMELGKVVWMGKQKVLILATWTVFQKGRHLVASKVAKLEFVSVETMDV